jgi:hypothetical protein
VICDRARSGSIRQQIGCLECERDCQFVDARRPTFNECIATAEGGPNAICQALSLDSIRVRGERGGQRFRIERGAFLRERTRRKRQGYGNKQC